MPPGGCLDHLLEFFGCSFSVRKRHIPEAFYSFFEEGARATMRDGILLLEY